MVQIPPIFWIVPVAGVLTLAFAAWLIVSIMRKPTGTPKMKEIGDMIFEGAWAFLKRQYSTIAIYSVVVAIIHRHYRRSTAAGGSTSKSRL